MAVKRITQEKLTEKAIDCLIAEITLCSKLNHSNIIGFKVRAVRV